MLFKWVMFHLPKPVVVSGQVQEYHYHNDSSGEGGFAWGVIGVGVMSWTPSLTWSIIPVSKWLITMVSESPNWGCSPSKRPKCLTNGVTNYLRIGMFLQVLP